MWVVTIVISLSAIVMGLVTFIRNPKSIENVYFFLLNLFISLWIICNYFSSFVSVDFVKILVSFDFILALLMTFTLFIFSCVFVGLLRKGSILIWLNAILYGSVMALMALIFFTQLIISNIVTSEGGINVIPGNLYWLYSVILVIPIVASVLVFIWGYRKSNIIKKTQIKFISFGLGIAAALLLVTNLVLPRLITSVSLATIVQESGYLGIIIFLGMTTYAIVKHQLLDIRMVVARSVTYILLLVVLAGFYAAAIFAAQSFIFPEANSSAGYVALQIALALIMAFSFQPLMRWITVLTDKIFFRNTYNTDVLLSDFSNTLSSTIILVEMLYRTSDLIVSQMKASRVMFALVDGDSKIYNIQASGYKETPDADPKDIIRLAKDGIIVADDLEDGTRLKHLMAEYQASIAVPLKTDKEVVGVFMLGEKSSGDMYSQKDLDVFEIVAPEITVAIENAKSYEEISRFNTTLRQEVKRATYRLKQKNEQLMELDRAKDEFISMASHQLRTPLTAIKGYLSMLLEGDAGDIKVSQYDFINEAYSGANRMVGLINDLLNVSRMETGRFFLEPKEVDIERVVEEETKQLQQQAKTKGLYLKIERKGKVPHIWADETKIRQVVMNFMDNALYYTINGGVTVVLKHDSKNFIYEVHDTGIGVPEEQRAHLFEKFFRADNARTTRPDGTGLGIYLAKRVVEDHGGTVIFESTMGKGSVFGFKFPLKKNTMARIASAPAPTPSIAAVMPVISVPEVPGEEVISNLK